MNTMFYSIEIKLPLFHIWLKKRTISFLTMLHVLENMLLRGVNLLKASKFLIVLSILGKVLSLIVNPSRVLIFQKVSQVLGMMLLPAVIIFPS